MVGPNEPLASSDIAKMSELDVTVPTRWVPCRTKLLGLALASLRTTWPTWARVSAIDISSSMGIGSLVRLAARDVMARPSPSPLGTLANAFRRNKVDKVSRSASPSAKC
jgi:hypothetical protein